MSLEHSPARARGRPAKQAPKASADSEESQRGVAASVLRPISVTIPTALQLTGLGRTKLYKLISEGRLKVIKIGTRTLVNFASLEALMSGEAAA